MRRHALRMLAGMIVVLAAQAQGTGSKGHMILSAFQAKVGTKTEAADATRMPAEKAKALFEDSRVRTFLKAVPEFGGACSVPDYNNTKARVTSPVLPEGAPPDAASSYYEVSIPCSGKVNAITVNAEFTPMTGPLNLALTLSFKE